MLGAGGAERPRSSPLYACSNSGSDGRFDIFLDLTELPLTWSEVLLRSAVPKLESDEGYVGYLRTGDGIRFEVNSGHRESSPSYMHSGDRKISGRLKCALGWTENSQSSPHRYFGGPKDAHQVDDPGLVIPSDISSSLKGRRATWLRGPAVCRGQPFRRSMQWGSKAQEQMGLFPAFESKLLGHQGMWAVDAGAEKIRLGAHPEPEFSLARTHP